MEAPNLPNIFKGTRNRPSGSRYKPMYYNPEKEELENRVSKIKKQFQDQEQESELRKVFMESKIANDPMRKRLQANRKGQMLRLTGILGVLILVTFKILTYLGFI